MIFFEKFVVREIRIEGFIGLGINLIIFCEFMGICIIELLKFEFVMYFLCILLLFYDIFICKYFILYVVYIKV